MRELLIGAVAMGFAVAGTFFLRFWRETRDRLFAYFAAAFFVLAVNRVGFAFLSDRFSRGEPLYGVLYWVRLLAFAIILMGILDKNLALDRQAKN